MGRTSEIEIELPVLHAGQIDASKFIEDNRFSVLRCGRRWGKTLYGEDLAANDALDGWPVGYFAPSYKILSEVYTNCVRRLAPTITAKSSPKGDGVIRLMTGGRIDFWSLENEQAGRSRKYKRVFVEEAAFAKPNMTDIWEKSIAPTLIDLRGAAVVLSNTRGVNTDNWMYNICTDPKSEWRDFHAPSWANPHLPPDEIERWRKTMPPLVFRQEIEAEFVDWSGVSLLALPAMLVDGQPVEPPTKCDYVFAVIDTAIKEGKQHDGTAVSFFARNMYFGTPLVLLDWDIISMEGANLEVWLPSVFVRLEALAVACGARQGSRGAYIEDKVTGSVLIQLSRNRGWPAQGIDSKLTAMGKSERAIAASIYIYQGMLKISRPAYDKVVDFKGRTRNHWITQVTGFQVGSKDGAADDLLDTATYGCVMALGGSEGI
jgi:hypothetical protein